MKPAKNTPLAVVQPDPSPVGDVVSTQAALEAGADWRKLAKPMQKVAPKASTELLMGGPTVGHNLVIDRTKPGALSVHIATDEQAFAEIFQAEASAEKKKKDPNAVGSRYLARTTGGMFQSVALDIEGKRFYLKVSLEEAKAKS